MLCMPQGRVRGLGKTMLCWPIVLATARQKPQWTCKHTEHGLEQGKAQRLASNAACVHCRLGLDAALRQSEQAGVLQQQMSPTQKPSQRYAPGFEGENSGGCHLGRTRDKQYRSKRKISSSFRNLSDDVLFAAWTQR